MGQPRAFVIMPFGKQFEDLWQLGFRETLVGLGCICERADEIGKPGFVVSQIQEHIIAADLVIAEMTGKNPNVFYEVGWAHALAKRTILCASDATDLSAFDTRAYRHFLHDGLAHVLRDKLNAIVPEILKVDAGRRLVAELIWGWPSDDYEPPHLEWKADPKKTGGAVQPDLVGGQSVRVTDTGEPVWQVQNTIKNWNHMPDWSVARMLYRSKALKVGDEVIASVIVRSDSEAQIEFSGDGTKVSDGTRVWARAFPAVDRRLSSPLWKEVVLPSIVTATEGGQDPAAEGVSIHLRFKTTGSIWIRQLALHRRSPTARRPEEAG